MRQSKKGSSNVFADLGLENPEELQLKSGLVFQIAKIIENQHLSQADVSKLLSVTQSKVSNLLNGKLYGFSVEILLSFLNALGQDVEIRIKAKPASRKKAQLKLKVAS